MPEQEPVYDHVIDWDKVESLNDVIEVLKGIQMSFDINRSSPKLKKFLVPMEADKDDI